MRAVLPIKHLPCQVSNHMFKDACVIVMAQHSTAQRSAAQHSTAQHSTAQHSTAQHSVMAHSLTQVSFTLWKATRKGVPVKDLLLGSSRIPHSCQSLRARSNHVFWSSPCRWSAPHSHQQGSTCHTIIRSAGHKIDIRTRSCSFV